MAGTRKIAAILVADIVGYRRVAGAGANRARARPCFRFLKSAPIGEAFGVREDTVRDWRSNGVLRRAYPHSSNRSSLDRCWIGGATAHHSRRSDL
jgi:hypothetical protein